VQESQRKKHIRVGVILMVLTIAAPVVLQIILEQLTGPGSSVSGGKLNGILLPINFGLTSLALQNLLRVIKSVPDE
jgi:hypothetical protein